MSDGLDIPITTPGGQQSADVLLRVAEALDRTANASENVGRKSAASASAWNVAKESARSTADAYNEVTTALSSVYNGFARATTRIVELATEQGRLDSMSARLGLNFDQAAAAAGRFADETEAMGAAGRFAAADIRLTQTELDAMMRVAGATSEVLGTDTAGAVQQLQEALIRGREGGLQRFGEGLASVAGESFTVQQRLDALVAQAAHTAAATDNATDRMNRFKDSLEDAQRVAAAAFVNETLRIQSFGEAARGAANDTDDLKNNMQALGETGAYVMNQTANLVGVLVGGIAMILAPAINGIRAALAVVTNPAALLPGGNARGLLADLNRIQEENASLTNFVGDRARGLMNGGRALDERTSAPAGAGGAADAAGRASNRAARGTATPAATGWGGSAGLMGDAPAAVGGGSGAGHSVFATRAQLAANARAFEAEQLAQSAHEKAVESAQLQRSIAARGRHSAREALFQQTDETRRASELAFDAKQREESAAYLAEQHRLAESTAAVIAADVAAVRAANDNERSNERGKGAEQSRLNKQEEERAHATSVRGYLEDQAKATVNLREVTVSAFDAMGTAASAHFDALVTGSESAGVALQGFVHDSLAALAKIAAQEAVFELGKGFAALFVNPVAAPAHFAAAALFGVAAAAAGGLAAATAPSAASAGAGRSLPAGDQRAARVTPQRSGNSDGGTVINVTFGGSIIGAGGMRQAAREIANVLNTGAVQGGVTLAPALMGAR